MSLIQEALEKASKPRDVENFYETPKPVQPAFQRVEKIKERAVLFQAANPKLPSKVQLSPQVLIRISVVTGLILLFGAVAALLNRTGKPGAMMAGVSLAASQSSILPLSDAETTKFVLTGITDSGNSKLALINNQVVAVGDRLQEKAFVKEIRNRTVVLDYNHKEIKLTL